MVGASNKIALNQFANNRLACSRFSATPARETLEELLAQSDCEVSLDFSDISATQAFCDELIGVLVLRHGPDVLGRLVFKSCSDDVKAILQFVAADRCDQYLKTHSH